jgi:hypothetical protein
VIKIFVLESLLHFFFWPRYLFKNFLLFSSVTWVSVLRLIHQKENSSDKWETPKEAQNNNKIKTNRNKAIATNIQKESLLLFSLYHKTYKGGKLISYIF